MLCKGVNKSGEACGAQALKGGDLCFMHSPVKASERAAARKRGGLNRRTKHGGDPDAVPREVRSLDDVLNVLDYALAETLALDNGIQRGRLLVALCSAYVDTLKTSELELRIETLEMLLKSR